MDLLRKLYLLTAENVKRAREGRNPVEMTRQRNDFKVNDLVLVRDLTSGAFCTMLHAQLQNSGSARPK